MQKPEWIVLIICALNGCAATSTLTPTAPSLKQLTLDSGTYAYMYHLEVSDTLAFRSKNYADLSFEVSVGPDGRIFAPEIGPVDALGRTVSDVATDLNAKFASIYREPDFFATVRAYAPRQVFVLGEAAYPGVQRTSGAITLMSAIGMAGGGKAASADLSKIVIFRKVQREQLYTVVNMHELQGQGVDPGLMNNDVIFIPKTGIASVSEFVNANILRILPYSLQINASRNYD